MWNKIKYHRWVVATVYFLMATGLAYAQEAGPQRDFTCPPKITEADCNALEAQYIKMKESAEKTGVAVIKDLTSKENLESAKEYMSIGKEIGVAIGQTAKELGVATNDFAKSEVGQWTMLIILFYVFGETIKAYVASAIILAVGIPFWIKMHRTVNYLKWVEIFDKDGKRVSREWRTDVDAIPRDRSGIVSEGVAVGKVLVNLLGFGSLLVIFLVLA